MVEAYLIAPTVIKLRRTSWGVVRHRRSFLQRAAVLEVRSDPGRSEAVVAELGGDTGCRDALRQDVERLPATGIVFRETTADYENSWHRAPRRQYVISLAGGISITASEGETRHIGAGEIVLVEDTTGKGHITRSSGGNPRHTIFVPID